MTQRSSSRKANASGSKSKINSVLNPAYDPENPRKSVGLVHPFVLESFLEDTRATLEQPKRKTTVLKKNSKTTEICKKEEPKRGVSPNRVRRSKNVVSNVGGKKSTDCSPVDETPSTSTKTLNKTKIVSSKLKSKTDVDSKHAVAKTILDTKNHEVLPTRELRSTRKYEKLKRELKSPSDFDIEDMSYGITIEIWYYEDENYYKKKLQVVLSDYSIPEENRREGNVELSYTYLLLDSRRCRNKENISWQDFIEAIFYIGKGTNKRAFNHAKETEKLLNKTTDKKKFRKIKEIWKSDNPIKVLFVTEDIIATEAYTREAAMIDAMGVKRLCNEIRGRYDRYGVVVTMKAREILELGATLLMEARDIFRRKETFDVYPKKITNDSDDSGEDEVDYGY